MKRRCSPILIRSLGLLLSFFPLLFGVGLTAVGESQPTRTRFVLSETEPQTVLLTENGVPIWNYVFSQKAHPWIDPSDPRSLAGCYFHPLYGFDGEILTVNATDWDNHAHHHGLWSSFTTVNLLRNGGTEHYDMWTDNTPLKRDFIRWRERQSTPDGYFFSVENGWFLPLSKTFGAASRSEDQAKTGSGKSAAPIGADREEIAEEILDVLTGRTQTDEKGRRFRTIDFTWRWRPLRDRIEIAGDRTFDKDFASMAIRFIPPAAKPTILSEEGEIVDDAMSIRRNWLAYQSDFSADARALTDDQPDYVAQAPPFRQTDLFREVDQNAADATLPIPGSTGGAAIFPHPSNPTFLGGWAVRHYGLIAAGWPGTAGTILDPSRSASLRYRLLIFEKPLTTEEIDRFYAAFLRHCR